MWRSFLLPAFLVFTTTGIFAQDKVDLYNLSLTDSTLRLIYVGYTNHFRVSGAREKDLVEMTGSVGAISQDPLHPENFTYMLGRMQTTDTIRVYVNRKLVISRIYAVRSVPRAEIILSGITDTVTQASAFSQHTKLEVIMKECPLKHNLVVDSYIITIKAPGGRELLSSEKVTGNMLTDETLRKIQVAPPGSHIEFQKPIVKCEGCAMKSLLPPLIIRLQ